MLIGFRFLNDFCFYIHYIANLQLFFLSSKFSLLKKSFRSIFFSPCHSARWEVLVARSGRYDLPHNACKAWCFVPGLATDKARQIFYTKFKRNIKCEVFNFSVNTILAICHKETIQEYAPIYNKVYGKVFAV